MQNFSFKHGIQVFALLGTLIIPSTSLAEDSSIETNLWISQGFTYNLDNDNDNGPVSFNDEADAYQLNQVYFTVGKESVMSPDEFDFGGQVDLLYGRDARYTLAAGFDDQLIGDSVSTDYKLAIPQAYLSANLPILNGVNVKAGHFYTIIGYEVVPAPDNFFYSHAYTMQYAEPFTHTGGLATTNFFDDQLTVTAGLVRGWDNFSDSADGNLSFLGGATLALGEDTSATLSVISGNEGNDTNRTMYSFVLVHDINEDFQYVLQHDYGTEEVDMGDDLNWYGLNQYLFYTLSEKTTLGARLEWFNDADGARVAGLENGSGGVATDYFAATFGANVSLYKGSTIEQVYVRPEVRFDWQNDGDSFDRNTDDSQTLISADLIVKF